VLTILLYGCEVWFLREDLFAKLRTFHNRCCRAMCRTTMAHTIRHHIKSKQLYKRLGIAAVGQYYHRRLLRWAGHVSRMPMSRVQRQLLTGWVAHSRPTGSPLMTFGRTLNTALLQCGQSPGFSAWSNVAADRAVGATATNPSVSRVGGVCMTVCGWAHTELTSFELSWLWHEASVAAPPDRSALG
jgi:hypothetical protein